METLDTFLTENNFKKVQSTERCYNYTYYSFYNITTSGVSEKSYLTKYTEIFGRFIYQKKFNTHISLIKYLKNNILP